MNDAVAVRYQAIEPLAQTIMLCLNEQVEKLGFEEPIALSPISEADYRLDKDPADGEYSLIGEWRDAAGAKLGNLMFHADGSFYVEHDVVRNHPLKANWFVEAVHAWGKEDNIKAEARLLLLPE
jgi:hypothetical protein